MVNTSPPGSFPRENKAETLFERLEAAGLTWKVYCDPPSHYSLTGIIHAPRLAPRFATNFFSTRQFFEDAENGELPTYSFIEPQIIGWNHNDMHPPFGGVVATMAKAKGLDAEGLHFDPPSSLIAGEDLLARIYNAIRSSSSTTGSNHLNTTLLVTFDEHGGTYDHVPPPPAVPPDGNGAPGQMGFTFDRSGVRIPTLAISAWIPEKTVVNAEHRATSLLATMREHYNLGEPFSAREASAPSFADVFTLTTPRPQDEWPEVVARPVPVMHETAAPSTRRSGCSASRSCSPCSPSPRAWASPSPTSSAKTRSPARRRSTSATRPSARSSLHARRRSVRTGCHSLGRLDQLGASVALPVGDATGSGRSSGHPPHASCWTPEGTHAARNSSSPFANVTVDGSESGALLRRLSSGTRRRGSSPDLLLGSLPPEGASPPLEFLEPPEVDDVAGTCRPGRKGRQPSSRTRRRT